MQDLTKDDLESAERIGFPVVFIVLLAVFGSLAAATWRSRSTRPWSG